VGAVTGQKYHYRLTGLLRNKPPQSVSRSDGYRFAPYWAVFDSLEEERNEQKEKADSSCSHHHPTGGLGASSGVAVPFGSRQLTYSDHRI